MFLIVILLGGLTVFTTALNVNAQNSEAYGPMSFGATNYGGEKDDYAYSIQQTSDIGLIMSGQTRSSGAGGSDLWLVKTGITPYYLDGVQKGVFQGEKWEVTFGGPADDVAYCGIQTAEGGFAAVGFTASFGAGGLDVYMVKTDASGKLQWNKTFGGTQDDCAYCIIQTDDGGFLLSGYTNSGGHKSAWIIKTDMYGNKMWDKILQGTSVNSAISTQDGYALAVENQNSFRLIKVDLMGDTVFDKVYLVDNKASTQGIVQANDGGYALAGWVNSGKAGIDDGLLVKTDVNGEKQWSQTYHGLGCYAMVKASNGGYALTGDRAFLLITDANGNVQWNQKYDCQSDDDVRCFTRMQSIIEATPDHFVMAGGYNAGSNGNMQLQWIQVTLKSGQKLVPPETVIIQPENKTYTVREVPLTFYVNEPTRFLGACLNGFNFTIEGNTTLKNLSNGHYNIAVLVTDTDLNHAVSQTVSFTVDSSEPYVEPKVSIQSPTNQTYNNTSPIILDFTVDQQAYWAVYSIDGQDNKTAYPHMGLSLNGGVHTLTVYAGGIAGGPAGYDTVTLNVTGYSWDYGFSYPTSSNQYSAAVNQIIQATVQAATSEEFLIIATAFLAFTVGVVIVLLVVLTKKGSKQNKNNRLIR